MFSALNIFFARITSELRNRIVSNNKKVLGRWNVDYCNSKINRKIDWSNVDHCGPCGSEKIQPTEFYLTTNVNKNARQ